LAEAQGGKRVVLFVDAAHFIFGAFLSHVWCFVRVFLRSPSGRQRFNVLGALDAVTRQVHLFTNETYITATSVCSLLSQVAAFYAPWNLPITLFLDNARYQRCHLVRDHAKALGLELAFLPSYSPNLNLIERYWRWVKKRCLNARYHPDFASMKNTILTTIVSAHYDYADSLKILLSWNFQLFSKIVVI
jgi:transposase